MFQFTCPSRSTTVYFGGYNNSFLVSIHVPLAEHDFPTSDQLYDFLVSIHVPLAEHDHFPQCALSQSPVSIHVPLAEHDMSCARRFARCLVSIHVPLAEHDDIVFGFCLFVKVSIHVPLAEHDLVAPVELRLFEVSIHVPLAEHDPSYCVSPDRLCVSIHVPLAEHDQVIIHPPRIQESFNSRAPRGARPRSRRSRLSRRSFQFTCPSRSTTPGQDQRPGRCQVSIHVPLAEHDLPCAVSFALGARFNSRAPRGARRSTSGATTTASWFQFTCPSRSTTFLRQTNYTIF